MPHKHKPKNKTFGRAPLPQEMVTSPQGTTVQQQVESFNGIDQNLKTRNFVPAFVFTDTSYRTKAQNKYAEAQSKLNACNAEASNIGVQVAQARFRQPVMVSTCGAEGRGYIKTGEDNLFYLKVQKAAEALYSTSSILRYIIDLLCGSGSELRYRYVTVVNGKPQVDSCRFEDAGAMLDERIASLRAELNDATSRNGQEPQTAVGTEEKYKSYRTSPKLEQPDPYATRNYENVGSTSALLQQAIEDKRTWERSMAEWQHVRDNSTDLDVLLRQWASDQSFFGLSYLKLSLEQGEPRRWGEVEKSKVGTRLVKRPKVVGVQYQPCVCSRMEEMSDELRIEHIYYSEKWRFDGTIKDMLRDIVAYPSIMPEHRKDMLERIVLNNQATTPCERPNVVMPLYIPAFDSPYYPVQAWWSIFSSMLYNLGSTIVSDAVTERENSTMFSYLIYLNMTWFEKYCADNHYDTDEEKEEAKKQYLQKISDFLKNKQNNGRIAALESITSADEKNILKSIEIVEVPHTSSKASIEDMELIGNSIFLAFNVHGSLVGSFGKNCTSSSGTQQRELTLLKQCQLMPQQRLYLNAWDFILRWNEFDPHAYMAVKQYDLSTLDASKTGLVERT